MDQSDAMDPIFKALADPSRRLLLDVLRQRDGQTLSALQMHLPMTRFGCAKHLKVLEDAGLVVARKVGREKHHYLNVVPLQLIHERWVKKYAESWAHTLLGLKVHLEEESMTDTAQAPSSVFEIVIQTTPERLWQAITDGEQTQQYFYGSRVQSTWEVGAPCVYLDPDGHVNTTGEVIAVDPPRRLVITFIPTWVEGVDSAPATVTWEIAPTGTACKLTVVHAGYDLPTFEKGDMHEGWVHILSSLKTYLETGAPLVD
jgi:uncharacterized protein YndB with AHSA1/START domain/DNA-binding transcriptional ArsR family regulator